MKPPLSDLNLPNPVLAAPMAGGPTTPALVIAAARVGSLGFLAGGYQTPEQLAGQIRQVRAESAIFGVNVFAPNPIPVDASAFRRYAVAIQAAGDEYGLDLGSAEPIEDDDHWRDKIDLLIADPVPAVSFTFGIPDSATIRSLRKAGTVVIQTVTSDAEARLAADAGVDVLAAQCGAAGGHSATLTPDRLPDPVPLSALIASVQERTRLPVIAAGGLATPAQVAAVLDSGADAVMVGTALLCTHESGASAVHRAAVANPRGGETVLTRAFTGRPARALPNRFTERYSAIAPAGYPALHHLTSPLRKAAVAAGNPESTNLWAGTGYRYATAESVQNVVDHLASAL